MDLAVQHVSEIFKGSLLIASVFASLLLAFDDLQPFKKLVLHLEDFLITLQVLESDVVMLFEQFFEFLLLLFILTLEFCVLFSQSLVSQLELFVDAFDLHNLLLFALYLLLDLPLVLFFFLGELLCKFFRVLLGLIEEVGVLDL